MLDDVVQLLNAWMENKFITMDQMNEKARLTTTLKSHAVVLSIPQVRAAVLARDILQGHLHE